MSRFRQPDEPAAELICFGWVLISPGKETEINNLMCTKTSKDDYENLSLLEVLLDDLVFCRLGATDIARDDIAVHQDLKDQLRRSKDSWYETKDWCGKTILLHCKTTNWIVWEEFSASFTNQETICFTNQEIKNYLRAIIRLFKNNFMK